jgi:capsular polysaccharide biosynthesis protein
MGIEEFFYILKEKIWTISAVVVFFVLLAAIFTFTQPLKYETKSRLLIIANLNSTDPYLLSKANENLGNVLADASVSDSFFNQVITAGFNIDKSYFGDSLAAQTAIWKKTITAKSVNDTGIIAVSIYHTNRVQADQISQAVDYVFKTQHNLYHSDNNSAVIRILDNPVTSNYPVKPNAAINFSLALLIGLVVSLVYIYLVSDLKIEKTEIYRTVQSEKPALVVSKPAIAAPAKNVFAGEQLSRINLNNYYGFEESNVEKFKKEKMREISEQVEIKETDDDELDNIIKHGSMANVFGQSNLSK